MLQLNSSIVSVDWLHQNIDAENLIILDATIPKVGAKATTNNKKEVIPLARFFDIKKEFSQQEAEYPNTVLTAEEFQEKAQNLGVQNNSCIVVYDDLGVYSSPRVWWVFQLMGFKNIAVLNGGLPAWKNAGLSTTENYKNLFNKGNFKANFQPEKLTFTKDVLQAINEDIAIIDARSNGRFIGIEPEPRKEVRGGHIPNSVNLPYGNLLKGGKLKPSLALKEIFKNINADENPMIFSCGSGITACILALGAEISGCKKYAVYDGSWTEWGSSEALPIKKL